MRIGFVGLGRLGLPVALAAERAGHGVFGVDVNRERLEAILARAVPEAAHEPDLAALLEQTQIGVSPNVDALRDCDIIFVCVQTPHEPELEGHVPVTGAPQDFDYAALKTALHELDSAGYRGLVVVVSTCLPGTVDRLTEWSVLNIAYNPLFIAMGSVIPDYEHPEFVLVGHSSGECPELLERFYSSLTDAPIRAMSIRSAELTKVAYNAYIGFKLMLANTVAEICDRTGADVDDVIGTLKLADKRLVSTAYLTPGMGDGGGCHPRDQIAMSWLASEVGLSSDPFGMVVEAREGHAEWLADLWCDGAEGLPMVMLGEAYKANTALTTGSAATLVAHYARSRGRRVTVTDTEPPAAIGPRCFFIATLHDWVLRFTPPEGSIVIDPWGDFPEREGVRIVRPGRRSGQAASGLLPPLRRRGLAQDCTGVLRCA